MWVVSRKVKKIDWGKVWNKKLIKMKLFYIEMWFKAKFFYIVCEGMNNEFEYFKFFFFGNV